MNLKSANRWQNILLFGGFVIGMVGIAVLDNLYIAILGLAMMAMSIVVWWMYHRCPYCHEQLGRGNPSAARNAARGSPTSRSPRRRKRSSTRKRSTERTRRPR